MIDESRPFRTSRLIMCRNFSSVMRVIKKTLKSDMMTVTLILLKRAKMVIMMKVTTNIKNDSN